MQILIACVCLVKAKESHFTEYAKAKYGQRAPNIQYICTICTIFPYLAFAYSVKCDSLAFTKQTHAINICVNIDLAHSATRATCAQAERSANCALKMHHMCKNVH
jgi:hypothetical protein